MLQVIIGKTVRNLPGYGHEGVQEEGKERVQSHAFADAGHRGSSLEANLYIAAFVFSLYKAEPEKITPEVVNEMVTAVFDSPFIVKVHKNKKCTLFTDKVQDKKVKESMASQNSPYELDWKFKYEKGVDEFYNTYTECGICKFGKRENCFEFVPCLCNMDERNYRNEGGELHRTKTLAQGDDCCNFHVSRIKK